MSSCASFVLRKHLDRASTQERIGESSQVNSAISILQQSLVAQTGVTTITDVTMKETVTFTGGGQQRTGMITLTGVSGKKSMVSVSLPSGTTSEVRQLSDTAISGIPPVGYSVDQLVDRRDGGEVCAEFA